MALSFFREYYDGYGRTPAAALCVCMPELLRQLWVGRLGGC